MLIPFRKFIARSIMIAMALGLAVFMRAFDTPWHVILLIFIGSIVMTGLLSWCADNY